MLVLDKYHAHLTNYVEICCNEHHIDMIEVPAHMMHVLLPLDIG